MFFTFHAYIINILVGEKLGFGEVGGGDGESQVSTPCMKHCLLRYNLVVEILEGWNNSIEGNRSFPIPLFTQLKNIGLITSS